MTKNYDFLPQLHFPDCSPLEVIYETRLPVFNKTLDLGLEIQDLACQDQVLVFVSTEFPNKKSLGLGLEQN